ncbi:MAG: AbrB/MazE/SpoVT family DNA-binding domain-containing protein [Acidobacteriota bacterium]
MIVASAKLTNKHQITLPAEVRQKLRIQPGDVVYLAVAGDQVVLHSLRSGWTEASRALGDELWRNEGGTAAIEAERDAWG